MWGVRLGSPATAPAATAEASVAADPVVVVASAGAAPFTSFFLTEFGSYREGGRTPSRTPLGKSEKTILSLILYLSHAGHYVPFPI